MGGSNKQTVGFKYFAGMQVAIGNCIEQILNVNPDKRGWIFTKPAEIAQLKEGDTSIIVDQPNLFGGDKQEGGWVGTIDIHTGRESHLRQNEYLAAQDSELVSSFPGLSYLVFHGNSLDRGFQFVSMSGMLKEVLYWVKRTRIKDDGTEQWYKVRPSDSAIVCEIEGRSVEPITIRPKDTFLISSFATASRINQDGPDVSKTSSETVTPLEDPEGVKSLNFTDWHNASDFNGVSNNDGLGRNYKFSGEWILETGGEAIFSFWVRVGYTQDNFSLTTNGEIIEHTELVTSSGVDHTYVIKLVSKDKIRLLINIEKIVPPVVGTNGLLNIAYENIPVKVRPYTYTYGVEAMDINPVHLIREIITNDTAMNKPEAIINDDSFKLAANRIYDEGLGVSGAFTEKSCKDAIDELLYHMEAGARLNRQSGLYEIVLFRDDLLDLDNAQLFDKSNIKSFNIDIANIDDVINSANVNFYDRDNIKDSSFSLDEIGSVMSGELNAHTLDFPYYMRRKNAELVGNWKLKQLSTPTRKGTFTTGKYEARKINKYDVVKLTWANQKMFEVPVRIMKIGLGDGRDNTVTLDWVEVIPYSSTVFPTINVDPPTSVVLPPQPNQSIVFEMPYFEAVQRFGQTQVDAELANNPDLGYLVVATKKPQSNSINALLYTDNGTGYQQASIVDYCPVATLDQDISYLNTSFAVKNVASISQAEAGTLILCEEELMVYQSYDTETKVLTVKRAALDTVPKPHLHDAVFYFYDAFNAFDTEQYVLSEVIDAKVLTTTPSGVLDMLEAPNLILSINARPVRPYPPANVKINGEYYPEVIETDVVVTWVDRNRIQQTGGAILGWTDDGVTRESGVTYSIELSSEDVVLASETGITANTYTFDSSIMLQNQVHILSLWAARDGYESYQLFEHSYSFGLNKPVILAITYSNLTQVKNLIVSEI